METYFKKEGSTTYYHLVCDTCGNEFIGKANNTKYCSKACKPKPKNNYIPKEPVHLTCAECGVKFIGRSNQKYCSELCRKEAFKRTDRYREYECRRSEIQKIKYKESHPKETGSCLFCGVTFEKKSKVQKYCSKDCCRRSTRKWTDGKRKVRQVDDSMKITFLGLIKKENNKCYICGKDCDLYDYSILEDGNICPEDNYPTVEHIIPISKGGKHEWGNVRLAHKICNSTKGNRYV